MEKTSEQEIFDAILIAAATSSGLRTTSVPKAISHLSATWKSRIVAFSQSGVVATVPRLVKALACPPALEIGAGWVCKLPCCPWCWARSHAAIGAGVVAAVMPPPPRPIEAAADSGPAIGGAVIYPRLIRRDAPLPDVESAQAPTRDLVVRRVAYTMPLVDGAGNSYLGAVLRQRAGFVKAPGPGVAYWSRYYEWRKLKDAGALGAYEAALVRPVGLVAAKKEAKWTMTILQLIVVERGESGLVVAVGKRQHPHGDIRCAVVSSSAVADYSSAVATALRYPAWFLSGDFQFVVKYLAARASRADEIGRLRTSAAFGVVRRGSSNVERDG